MWKRFDLPEFWELLKTILRARTGDTGRGLTQPSSCVCATLFTSLPTLLSFLAYSFPWSPTDVNFGEPGPVPQTQNLSQFLTFLHLHHDGSAPFDRGTASAAAALKVN